ncbi:MAG: ABC transporter permease [Dehalococcoidia bacterium]
MAEQRPVAVTPEIAPPPGRAAFAGRASIHPTLRRCLRDRTVQLSGGLLVVLALGAILAPYVGLPDPATADLFNVRAEPSVSHWLGTDALGRDTFARVVHGGRVSLLVGFIAVSVAVVVGVPLGLLTGFVGGALDTVVMRVVEVIMAVPGILLALAIMTTLGPGIWNAMLAIGFVSSPGYVRLIRGEALSARSQDYVLASRAVGAGNVRLMAVHVFPATLPALIVQISLGIAFAILTEAGLSFLGLGVQPPTPSWGGMVQVGYPFLQTAPWMVIGPGTAIFVAVLAFNLLGDGLRDVLDPRLRNRDAPRGRRGGATERQ